MKLNPHSVGMTLGTFAAFLHLLWLILIGGNLAQPFMDWMTSMHMVKLTYGMMAFGFGPAIILLIGAFIWFYIFGWIFAKFWNYFNQ